VYGTAATAAAAAREDAVLQLLAVIALSLPLSLSLSLFPLSPVQPLYSSNNVEATLDFVAFDNVASTLLPVWTGY